MISETYFASRYYSFWRQNTPWLGDYYSTLNSLVTKICMPIDIEEDPKLVYINNIVATTHFRNISGSRSCTIEQSFQESIPFIELLPGKKLESYSLTDNHRRIIKIQAERMAGRYSGECMHDPPFPGCGIMSNCNGDLLWGKTLVEIKARTVKPGRRPFHMEDFKQLLLYCALNHLSDEKYDIQKIELFNPREGYLWQSDLREFVLMISNSATSDLFENTGSYLTSLTESADFSTGFDGTDF
jgi:hypothetical protein